MPVCSRREIPTITPVRTAWIEVRQGGVGAVVAPMVEVEIPTKVLAIASVYVGCCAGHRAATGNCPQPGSTAAERLPVRAGLEGPDTAVRPSAQDGTNYPVQVLPGQLPNVIDDCPMTDIEQRVAAIQLRLSEVSGIAFAGSRPVGGGCAAVPG